MSLRGILEALDSGDCVEKAIVEADRRVRAFDAGLRPGRVEGAKELADYLDATFVFRGKRRVADPAVGMARNRLMAIYSLLTEAPWVTPQDLRERSGLYYVLRAWESLPPDVKTLAPLVAGVTASGGVQHQIETGQAIYQNRAGMALKRFAEAARAIDEVWSGITGWRAKALKGKLRVAFVGAQELKAQGKYVKARDEMLVRMTPKVLNRAEGYGTFRYILVHELGHRYELLVGPPPTGAVDHTTRYSYTDSMAGDEAFAELFALGHFGIRKDAQREGMVLDRFEQAMGKA